MIGEGETFFSNSGECELEPNLIKITYGGCVKIGKTSSYSIKKKLEKTWLPAKRSLRQRLSRSENLDAVCVKSKITYGGCVKIGKTSSFF